MSDDVYQTDPNRILVRTTTGGVQAWKADTAATAVVVSFDLNPRDAGAGHAQFSQFMTTADARSLADALIRAAGHAESLLRAEAA